MELSKWGGQRKIEIIAKEEPEINITSNILANFKTSNKTTSNENIEAVSLTRQDKGQFKEYSPYISELVKTIEDPPEAVTLSVLEPVVEKIFYTKVPVNNDIELKVFKHKEVNSLIRNRILALESSVISKTVEKKPLEEVDKTIKKVITIQHDEELLEQLKYPKTEEVSLPTSSIRQLAQEMHKAKPVIEVNIPILQSETDQTDDESESEEESEEEEHTTEDTEEEIPALAQFILKEPTTPLKPILSTQYSYSMDAKFHEEKDNDGWKNVAEVSAVVSSTESEDRSDDGYTKVIPKEKISNKKHTSKRSPTTFPSESDYTSDETLEAIPTLEKKTVRRILDYDIYDEQVNGNMAMDFEEYVLQRQNNPHYEYDYDSATLTDYSEFTNAEDNQSFINYDYSRRSDDQDTPSEDSEYTESQDYYDDSENYASSVFEAPTMDDESRSDYYTDDDVRTLVDETEYYSDETYEKHYIDNDDVSTVLSFYNEGSEYSDRRYDSNVSGSEDGQSYYGPNTNNQIYYRGDSDEGSYSTEYSTEVSVYNNGNNGTYEGFHNDIGPKDRLLQSGGYIKKDHLPESEQYYAQTKDGYYSEDSNFIVRKY